MITATVELGKDTLAIIHDAFNTPWYYTPTSGAFVGAFSAFMFTVAWNSVQRAVDRKKTNRNALVKIKHLCNENLDIAHDIKFVAEDITRVANESISTGMPNISFNNFKQLVTYNHLLIDLLNIGFLNKLVSINSHMRKLNDSLEANNNLYGKMNDGIFQQTIDPIHYSQLCRTLIGQLETLIRFTEAFIDENINILATVRILLRYKVSILPQRQKTMSELETNITQEVEILQGEVEQIRASSQERIDEIAGR